MLRRIDQPDTHIVNSIVQLEQQAFGRGGLNEWHLVPLVRHGRVYIYEIENTVAGCVQYILDWQNPKSAYMFGLSVSRNWRGQGIGTKILTGSLDELAADSIAKVELTVDPANTTAVNLYENKFGFRIIDQRAAEYGQGEDRLVMVKYL